MGPITSTPFDFERFHRDEPPGELLRLILDHEPECVKVLDRDGTLLFINPSGLRMIEAESPDQIVGQPVFCMVSPQYRQAFVAAHEQVFRGEPTTLQFEIIGLKGTHRWLEGHGIPIKNQRHDIELHLSITRDITEPKATESQRIESERKYRELVDSLEAIVWEATPDTLRVTYISPGVQRFLGTAPADWLSGAVTWRDMIHPEDFDAVMATCLREIAAGHNHVLEYRMRATDGRIVWVRDIITVVMDQDRPVTVRGVIVDITEGKLSERRLAAQYAVTEVLAESSALTEAAPRLLQVLCAGLGWEVGGLWSRDDAANVLRPVAFWHLPTASAQAFVARSRRMTFGLGEGMPGRVWAGGQPAWIPDVVADPNFPRASIAAQEGLHAACGFPIISGNQIIGVLEFFSHDIQEPDQELLQMLGATGSQIGQFVERKLLEAQLRQAQKLEGIGQLAGGIAHDFNNLLTVINGYSDIVLQALSPSHPVRAHIVQVREAGERAVSLTRQILAFSRKQTLVTAVFNLNDAVASMERLLRRLIGEHITLVTALDPSSGFVDADQGQIEQVILNLAVNGRDAMPKGGTLTIETQIEDLDEALGRGRTALPPGPYIKLSVRDTGCGMDEGTQAHIFEPFFTTKEPGRGTGLGLATVYGIVMQSGGTIHVESQPGRGSTFSIYLPRVSGVGQPAGKGQISPELPRGSDTVLLVEDDDPVRALTGQILRELGYTVLEAKHAAGARALSAGDAGSIHLLLTDLLMPGTNGRELADHLRSRHPGMKVLFISGYDQVPGNPSAGAAGTAFLAKPFTVEALARKVRELLEG